jgi:hypothetical protein
MERAERPRNPPPLELKKPFGDLPWDMLQDEVGVTAADFLAIVVGLLLRLMQTQRGGKPIDTS